MFFATILFSFILSVTEMQAAYHPVYFSKKLRSNVEPFSGGYVYRVYNQDPGSLSAYGYSGSNEDTSSETLEKFNSPLDSNTRVIQNSAPIGETETAVNNNYFTEPSSRYEIDYKIAKAESKYGSKFLPSKTETDAMYERLKSVMHYHPPVESDDISSYEHSDEYNLDDDDVRSSSRSMYNIWPHYYRSPYEYEQMKIDSEIEKAKDKRYAADNARASIPVHEDLDGDPLNTYGPLSTMRYSRDTATDNPISGDQPFFSFVLNDYFNRNKEDDAFVFKVPDWGMDFDKGSTVPYLDDYLKRERRLGDSKDWKTMPHYNDGTLDSLLEIPNESIKLSKETIGDKLIDKTIDFNNNEKSSLENTDTKTQYEHKANKYNGFKDFVGSFAKMFGSVDHKKDSKYTIKKNQEKGENKKGFRKVYHKNEYQEEDEFCDNNNSTANAEETGKSSGHMGAAEAFIRSLDATAIDNNAVVFNKNGKNEDNKYAKNHEGFGSAKRRDKLFHEYRDVAKKAAQSNNADYTDHFRI